MSYRAWHGIYWLFLDSVSWHGMTECYSFRILAISSRKRAASSNSSFFAASLVYRLRAPLSRAHLNRGNHAKQSVVLARVSLLSPMAWF